MPDTPISIFISYAHVDSPFVDRLEADLRQQGFETWVDRQRLEGGQRWRRELQEAVEQAKVLLIVLSPEAIASPNVQIEYDYALDLGKGVIPLHYHQTNVPMELRAIQWIDFRHSYEDGLAALLRALKQQITMETPDAETRPAEGAQGAPQQPIEEPAPVPAAQLQALAPLVGRQVEWSRLQQLWQQTTAGKAQLVVIAGEAGVGKTRLAEELLALVVQQQLSTARAACYAVESTLAYAPVSVWLHAQTIRSAVSGLSTLWLSEVARFVPEILVERPSVPPPGPLTESWQQQRLFEALARAILAARQPLLLLLDDLHWCDRETLNWLHYLLRFNPQARLLILATLRSEELTDEHPVQGLLTTLAREGLVTQISLEALSRDETASLATQTAGGRELGSQVLSQLYQDTEGNPLFVVETVRIGGLADSGERGEQNLASGEGAASAIRVPPTIQTVIVARLAQLSPLARELVNVAAVIGRPFSVEVLVQASKRDEADVLTALDELWQRRIVREAEAESYDFSHAKIREVAYADLRPPRRRLLHRQVAQALEAVYANRLSTVSGQLALHYEQAGEWAKTMQYAQQAGEQAQRVYDPRTAIEQYTRALEATQKGAIAPPLTVYRLRGQVYETLGNFERARVDDETALEMARSAGDGQEEWQGLLDLGFLWMQRDYAQAGSYYQQALELAKRFGDTITRAHSLNRLGNWYLNTEEPDQALHYHQEALTLFQQAQDQHGIAETYDLLGIAALIGGDLVQAAASYQQAISLFQQLDDRQVLINSLSILVVTGGGYATETSVPASISFAEALQFGERALKLARETGQRPAEGLALLNLGLSLGAHGEYTRALEVAQESLALAEQIEHREWMTHGYFDWGALNLDLLALSQARQHLEHALTLAHEIGSLHWIGVVSGYLGSAYLLQHDLPQAESLLNAALPVDAPSQTVGQRLVWAARAELVLARGDAQQALDIADRLIASAANRSQQQVIPYLWKVRGEALAALHQEAEAEAVLQAAQEAARVQGLQPLFWRIGVVLGKCYQTLGRKVEAEEAFSTARTIIEELGANIPDEQLREQFLHQATAMLPRVLSPEHPPT